MNGSDRWAVNWNQEYGWLSVGLRDNGPTAEEPQDDLPELYLSRNTVGCWTGFVLQTPVDPAHAAAIKQRLEAVGLWDARWTQWIPVTIC